MKTQDDILAVLVFICLCIILLWVMRNHLIAMLGESLLEKQLKCNFLDALTFDFLIQKKQPRWIILRFSRGIGYYNGTIKIMNGENLVCYHELPALEEFANKYFKIHNTVISRSNSIITIPIRNYNTKVPSTLILKLNCNIVDKDLLARLKVAQEVEISIVIRG